MYLTATRPDIMHVISLISGHGMSTEIYLLAAKRIIKYLQGIYDYGLFYKYKEKSYVCGFIDSDYARDQNDRKSTSGYLFMLGTTTVS